MKLRIYADTSVFGGCYDDEFSEYSKILINEVKQGSKVLVISDLTLKELENAPEEVKDILTSIPEKFKGYILLDYDARSLSKKYIEEKAISDKHIVDSQHIAMASVNRVDVLVSWNFKHIVNLRRINLYNATN